MEQTLWMKIRCARCDWRVFDRAIDANHPEAHQLFSKALRAAAAHDLECSPDVTVIRRDMDLMRDAA